MQHTARADGAAVPDVNPGMEGHRFAQSDTVTDVDMGMDGHPFGDGAVPAHGGSRRHAGRDEGRLVDELQEPREGQTRVIDAEQGTVVKRHRPGNDDGRRAGLGNPLLIPFPGRKGQIPRTSRLEGSQAPDGSVRVSRDLSTHVFRQLLQAIEHGRSLACANPWAPAMKADASPVWQGGGNEAPDGSQRTGDAAAATLATGR